MKRVYVVVEGQTEESFIAGCLAESLLPKKVCLTPIILGVPGHKGGRTNYARVEKDILRLLKQNQRSYCTTMIDYFSLGSGFPGTPVPNHLINLEKVERIERAVKDDICKRLPDLRPDARFVPYLSLHEYESLLFGDPATFALAIGKPHLAARFEQVRNQFATPEDINDAPETSPSKRVLSIHSAYKKVIDGLTAAQAIGVEKMRSECSHFRNWLSQLENLPEI